MNAADAWSAACAIVERARVESKAKHSRAMAHQRDMAAALRDVPRSAQQPEQGALDFGDDDEGI